MSRLSCVVAASVAVVACNAGTTNNGIGDGGTSGGNGSTACNVQPENVRTQLCDPKATNVLYACDEGAPAPRDGCTRTVQANAYCCPTGSQPEDAGADAAILGVSPYGDPYPTDQIGWNARAGTQRGDRIANLVFQGYRQSETQLRTTSMAGLYDPKTLTHDVVFIVCVGAWDSVGKATLQTLKASTKRIKTLAVLGEGGTPGSTATLSDLSALRLTTSWATTVLDPAFKAFGAAFDAAALPFVMVIDARTMEISSAAVGGMTDQTAVDAAVTSVTSRPPAY